MLVYDTQVQEKMAAAAQLLLSGMIELNIGRSPSVSIHPTKNIAVRVNDCNISRSLYYSVGKVCKEEMVTSWGDLKSYGTGQDPSVALIEIEKELYVVETHCSTLGRHCCFMVGEVDEKEQTIKWGPKKWFCSGLEPKICVNADGVVIIVKQKAWGTSYGLKYHIGNVNTDGKSIDWLPGKQCISVPAEGKSVSQPAIDINGSKIILVYHSHPSKLNCLLATLDENKRIGSWTQLQQLQGGGIYPSISINSLGFIVQSNQNSRQTKIYHRAGKIEGDKIQWNPASILEHARGKYPSISLADDGHILEVHKYGWTLFSSQGTIHTRDKETVSISKKGRNASLSMNKNSSNDDQSKNFALNYNCTSSLSRNHQSKESYSTPAKNRNPTSVSHPQNILMLAENLDTRGYLMLLVLWIFIAIVVSYIIYSL